MLSFSGLALALALSRPAAAGEARAGARLLRVATYNAHSCKGWDRLVRPQRIADVLARYHPDVVALQEVRAARGGGADQPALIARALGMRSHFLPLVRLLSQDYGIAVLSRYPMRVVREERLPTVERRLPLERRGAIWVELDVDGVKVQLLDTHLGLSADERALQVRTLTGPDWMGSPGFKPPFVAAGDLNSSPGGEPYRKLSAMAQDAAGANAPSTIPSLAPMRRIDYVFVSSGTAAAYVPLAGSFLERLASDHLPVVVDVALPARFH